MFVHFIRFVCVLLFCLFFFLFFWPLSFVVFLSRARTLPMSFGSKIIVFSRALLPKMSNTFQCYFSEWERKNAHYHSSTIWTITIFEIDTQKSKEEEEETQHTLKPNGQKAKANEERNSNDDNNNSDSGNKKMNKNKVYMSTQLKLTANSLKNMLECQLRMLRLWIQCAEKRRIIRRNIISTK